MALQDLQAHPDLRVPPLVSVLVLPDPTPLRFLPLPFLPVLQDPQVRLDRLDQPAQRVRRVVTERAEVRGLQVLLVRQDPLVPPEAQDPKV